MRVYVKLRLAVLEIFAVKWPNFRPKISDLGDLLGVPPPKMGEDLSGTDMCYHAKFHTNRCHNRFT